MVCEYIRNDTGNYNQITILKLYIKRNIKWILLLWNTQNVNKVL